MAYRVQQMMPAAPGMYLVDTEKRTATLVVMWALVTKVDTKQGEGFPEQQIVGLTHLDLGGDLADALSHAVEDGPDYTTQVPTNFKTFR